MNTEIQPRLLIVDDDEEIRHLLAKFLSQYQFKVIVAKDGSSMRESLEKYIIDLIILDLMLPGEDGLSLCKSIRTQHNIPIIMLTAIGEDTDRIIGLEMGADDYMAKPFNPRELLARVRAILRRVPEHAAASQAIARKPSRYWHFNQFILDTAVRRLVNSDEIEITISSGEYDLLLALIKNSGRVLSRDELLDITKNREAGPFDRSIDVQISRLRHKIERDPKSPQLIKTVRGGGYLFTPDVTTA